MRKVILLVALALLAVALVAQETNAPAQQPGMPKYQTNLSERPQAPSYSDLYCAGFISNESISVANTVGAGINSPNETQYGTGNTIYLLGSGYQDGALYTILRPLRDPNRYEPFKGQRRAIQELGQPYAEVARVRVKALRGPAAVADIEFACQHVSVGDIVVPFREHPAISYRKNTVIDQFPNSVPRVSARVVMAREFDTQVATGQKVYISAGADKGVKVGDYFRIVRGYDKSKIDPVDATAYKAPPGDDTQKVQGRVTGPVTKLLPVHTLGEAIVLNVTPTSATAMITNALYNIQVGDEAQLENEQ